MTGADAPSRSERRLLLAGLTAAGIALGTLSGCSLVVDTDECVIDEDCDFGGDTQLRCVSNECVPVSDTTARFALVPSDVNEDTTLDAATSWVIHGVVLVERATLTVEPEATLEVHPNAAIVLAPDAELIGADHPALKSLIIEEHSVQPSEERR